MTKKRRAKKSTIPAGNHPRPKTATSLLDVMEDGKEFYTLLNYKFENLNITNELRKALKEIESIRKRPAVCYLSNVVNPYIKRPTGINIGDDLPFSEMVHQVPNSVKEIDVIIVTPGGLTSQVAKFVDKLRPRFDQVSFLIPNLAMSAGTIFAMSGDEIIMGPESYLGPIDPQVPGQNGRFMPAQAILTLIKEIEDRGKEKIKEKKNPNWTDLQILKQIDAKEIGTAINASGYAAGLVERFLLAYKFKTWDKHSSSGAKVTDEEKKQKALEIAQHLCSHKDWQAHDRGITRDEAWNDCRIKITHTESIEGLTRVFRRFWATCYWVFENTRIAKFFMSDSYSVFRYDPKDNSGGK